MEPEHIFIILCLLSLFIVMILARSAEKKIWNNGICVETGEPWKHFDTDSQGGRGYTSIDGNSGKDVYTWISYNVDK